MISARGVALLVVAALLWALARLLGIEELYVVAAAAAAIVLVALVAVRLSATSVSARRGISSNRLHPGETAEVSIELRNESRWDRDPLLLVTDGYPWTLAERPRFTVTDVPPGRTIRLSYPIRGSARGRYRIGPVQVARRDAFGVAQLVRHYRATDELVVYPVIETLPEGVARASHRGSGSSRTRRLFSAGDEFHTMREYQQGDDLRLIHWPSTAHRSTLMVRQQELPWQAEATVFCDTRLAAHHGSGPSSTLEQAISAAASVVWHLTGHAYRLRLLTADDLRIPRVAPWQELLDRLAELEGSRERRLSALPALRGAGADGLFVALTTPMGGDGPLAARPDARALLEAGRGFASRVAVVVHRAADEEQAVATAGLLRVAGWRAITLRPGQSLAERWRQLVRTRPAVAMPER